MQNTTVFISGPTFEKMFGPDSKAYNTMRQYLTDIVSYFYAHKNAATFSTGGEPGVETLVAQAVENAKVNYPYIRNELHLTRPVLPEISKLADKVYFYQSEEDQLRTITKTSDYIILVAPNDKTYHNDKTAEIIKMVAKEQKPVYKITYTCNDTEFTDITMQKVSGRENPLLSLKGRIFTGYFAKMKEYEEMHLRPVSVARVTPPAIICQKAGLLAPPSELLSKFKTIGLSDEEYRSEYLNHLLSVNVEKEINSLPALNKNEAGFVFLCYEKPEDFCHRHILAEYLNNHYNLDIQEVDFEKMLQCAPEIEQNDLE